MSVNRLMYKNIKSTAAITVLTTSICFLLYILSPSVYAQEGVKRAGGQASTALYEETIVDMNIKTLGGVLELERQWSNGRWTFNPKWSDLQFFKQKKQISAGALIEGGELSAQGHSGNIGSGIKGDVLPTAPAKDVEAIRMNVFTYEAANDKHTVYRYYERNTILRTNTGFTWQDHKGNWKEYNLEGQLVSFGDRNNITTTLNRDTEGRITTVVDHFGTTLATFAYDAAGYLQTLTDYSGRKVTYTWVNQQLTNVKGVRGFDWGYTYEDQGGRAAISSKSSAGVRSALFELEKIPEITMCVGGPGGHWELIGEKWEYRYTQCTATLTVDTMWVFKGWSDAVGAKSSNSYFYDDKSKTYKNMTFKPGQGRIETETNLRGDVIATYINNELLLKTDISTDYRRKVETDHNDYKTTKEYDERLNLIKTTYADGATESWTYNTFSQVLTHTNENGVVTKNTYDANGNLKSMVEALGKPAERTTEYDYDTLGRLTQQKQLGDANTQEAITRWTEYDNYGNALTQIDPEGIETKSTYDVLGNVLTYKDGKTNTWSKTYDERGNLLTTTDPLNHTNTYTYDPFGNLLTVKNALNHTLVTYTYNDRNKLTSETDVNNFSITYTYNEDGMLESLKDKNGKLTHFNYNTHGLLSSMQDPAGNIYGLFYGENGAALGGVSKVIFPHFTQIYTYNKRYKLSSISLNEGDEVIQSAKYHYDAVGNKVQTTDSAGNVNIAVYDALNRMLSLQDAALNTVKYTYDDRDNQLTVTNELQVLLRQYQYDLKNQSTTEIWPNNSTFTTSYDANGNVKTKTDAKGQIQQFIYDLANRNSGINYYTNNAQLVANTPQKSTTFTYNNANSLTGYDDGTTSAIYTFNNLQQKTGATVNYGAFSKSHSYSYSPTAQKKTLTNPDGGVDSYYYTAIDQINRISLNNQANITVNSYDWLTPKKITYPGGTTQENNVDGLLRIKQINAKDPAKNTLLNYNYLYDAVGNIQQKNTEHGAYNYTYDDLDRLLTAENPTLENEAYTYDATGNRKTDAGTTEPWEYNTTNQLLTAGSEADVYTYDANGNRETLAIGGQSRSYVYNLENRMSEVRDASNNLIASYQYDPFGRRISKTVNGIKRYFYYVDEGLIAEFDNTGAQLQAYGYTPDGIWGTDPTYTKLQGSYYYYLNDHLGASQKIVATNGEVVWSAKQSAFGEVSVDPISSITNHLRFAGQYYDEETDTNYNYFRDYDPTIGRYIQSDPVGLAAGVGTYTYAMQNPLYYIDHNGKIVTLVIPAIQIAIAMVCAAAADGSTPSSVLGAGIGAALPGGLGFAIGGAVVFTALDNYLGGRKPINCGVGNAAGGAIVGHVFADRLEQAWQGVGKGFATASTCLGGMVGI